MKKVIFMVNGEFMRTTVISRKLFFYDGRGIYSYCMRHIDDGEELSQIRFYDAFPCTETGYHPIEGDIDFGASSLATKKTDFLRTVSSVPRTLVRLGHSVLAQDAWQIRSSTLDQLINGDMDIHDIEAKDFYPNIRQKGVDVYIGMDAVAIALKHLADIVVIIANSVEYVPAITFMREEGITVVLDPMGNYVADSLRAAVDYVETKVSQNENSDIRYDRKDIMNFMGEIR